MSRCLKCGDTATLRSADTDLPMCAAHSLDGNGEPDYIPDVDDFDMEIQSDELPDDLFAPSDSYLNTDGGRDAGSQ